MLIDCTTKGCLAKSEAKLDLQSGDVICDECGNVIEGVTEYTKKALKGMGQILRHNTKQPFMALCKACNKNQPLYTDGGRAFCKSCNTQVHITASFLRGLKQYEQEKEKE